MTVKVKITSLSCQIFNDKRNKLSFYIRVKKYFLKTNKPN